MAIFEQFSCEIRKPVSPELKRKTVLLWSFFFVKKCFWNATLAILGQSMRKILLAFNAQLAISSLLISLFKLNSGKIFGIIIR